MPQCAIESVIAPDVNVHLNANTTGRSVDLEFTGVGEADYNESNKEQLSAK